MIPKTVNKTKTKSSGGKETRARQISIDSKIFVKVFGYLYTKLYFQSFAKNAFKVFELRASKSFF